MRQFIRHPLDVPIEIRTAQRGSAALHTQDISLGGLAVHSDAPVEPGSTGTAECTASPPRLMSSVWKTAAGAR